MKSPFLHLLFFVSALTAIASERAANTVILNETGVKNLRVETVLVEETTF
jgi:hypothetical protein